MNLAFFELGIPVLGICWGQQAMAQALGDEVARTGHARVRQDRAARDATRLHAVRRPPRRADGLDEPRRRRRARARRLPRHRADGVLAVAGFEDRARDFYGVQFHPEVAHTPNGTDPLKNFLCTACDARPLWTRHSIFEEAVADVRARVGDSRIICGLSGGVDSSVAAVLVHKAVGDNLMRVFVDHGLMRKGEIISAWTPSASWSDPSLRRS